MNERLRLKLELIWYMNERGKEFRSLMAQFNAISAPQYHVVQEYPSASDLFMRLDASDFELLDAILTECVAESQRETPALAVEVSA
jgi:hypothetical protein